MHTYCIGHWGHGGGGGGGGGDGGSDGGSDGYDDDDAEEELGDDSEGENEMVVLDPDHVSHVFAQFVCYVRTCTSKITCNVELF